MCSIQLFKSNYAFIYIQTRREKQRLSRVRRKVNDGKQDA